MGIRLRFLGILMIVLVATHFDFQSSTFRFESPLASVKSLLPERGFYCTEDSVILRSDFERFIDLPTIFARVLLLVVYTRRPENSSIFGRKLPCGKGRRRISGCTWICSTLQGYLMKNDVDSILNCFSGILYGASHGDVL